MTNTKKGKTRGNRSKNAAARKPQNKSNNNNRMQARAAAAPARVNGHVRMIVDPCNATLSPTAYRGQDGYISRFSSVGNISTVYQNFVIVYYPAYNGIFVGTYLAFTDPLGTISYTTPGPGQAFCLATCAGQRPVGACISLDYAGTELNRGGTIAYGSIKASSLVSTMTFSDLIVLLGHSTRTPDSKLEVKWQPSPADEEYWATGSAAPDGGGDRNVIVVAGYGLPAATNLFNYRPTAIIEWNPKATLGLSAASASSPDAPAGLEHVRTKLANMGNWWIEGANTVSAAFSAGKQIYNTTKNVAKLAMLAL